MDVLVGVFVARQKEQMKVKNGGKLVDERHLFHGTEPSIVDAICEQNFDWRVCGIHGSHYGKGECLYSYIND